ncbi:MAG: hypothetical protein Q4B87_01930 [Candidatus Saccharibacteria bacterium]|nr:hypothetical protein [Candidatus Saccharibacteria bacterium]
MSKKKLSLEKVRPRYSNKLDYNDLINLESQWGGTLFGPIPAGHQRMFFEHKKNVWVWYEGWLDAAGSFKETTVRYEVRPAGVFKRVSGQKYEKLSGAELDSFRTAAKNYLQLIKTKLYY